MKIKDRLAFNFSLITSGVLLVLLVLIYFVFYSFIRNDFYEHLNDRAKVAAQLYLEADEISSDSLSHVRERYLAKLPGEAIGIFDERNKSFIANDKQLWSERVIDRVRKKKNLKFYQGSKQAVGIYYKDNQGDFVILVSAPDYRHDQQMEKAAELMLLIFFVLNGLIFFAGRWFAQRSLAPINRIIAQMQQITVQNLHVRVDDGKGKDEIAELAQNFNRLLVHLQSSFELQQAFVSNASHELRTPVTSIIGEIEVSLNYERTAAEYQQVLNSVLYESERLNNTITSLMELAQADFEYSRAKLSPVMIDELIWELHAFWIKKLGQGKFLLDIQHLPDDAGMLSILANKSLLSIAFNNIINNAFKFSNNQPVRCILNVDENSINVIIEDSGIGVPDVDAEKIFDSFYRSPNGRTYPGTGVGLYVTQKIIQLFKGEINMLSIEGKGTTFKISFYTSKF